MMSTDLMSISMMRALSLETAEYFYPLPRELASGAVEEADADEAIEGSPAIPWSKPTASLVRQQSDDVVDDGFVVVGHPRSDASSSSAASKASTILSASRLEGTICRYLPDKRFGFIRTAGGVEVFFHERHCLSPPIEGRAVSFRLLKDTRRGRNCAQHIREEQMGAAPLGAGRKRTMKRTKRG